MCMHVLTSTKHRQSLFSNSPDVVVDAGGLSLALSPAASCPASVSNSLSCLITVADEHVCTGTADSVWKKIYLTSSCPRLFPATGGFFLLLLWIYRRMNHFLNPPLLLITSVTFFFFNLLNFFLILTKWDFSKASSDLLCPCLSSESLRLDNHLCYFSGCHSALRSLSFFFTWMPSYKAVISYVLNISHKLWIIPV